MTITSDETDKLRRPLFIPGSKTSHTQDSLTESSESEDEPHEIDKRLLAMRENITKVVLGSTAMPFRWLTTSYRCFYCYDMFETVPELKAHNLLHERDEITRVMQKYWENDVFVDISKLSCIECLDDFKSLNELIDHLVLEHGVEYDDDTKFCFKPFILKEREVVCGICESSFKLFNQLLLHATKEHRNPEDYICDFCGRSFKKHQYKMHVHNEHRSRNVNCTQCGEVFSSYALRTHMIKAHGRKVKCKMCSETFPTYYKKQQHMTTVHRTRSEIKCPHCVKTFYFQSSMLRHLRQMHLKEKNAICNVCGWTTFSQSQLKDHMVKHKDTRDVSCKFCNKLFKAKKYLKLHYHITHPEELERENGVEPDEDMGEESEIEDDEESGGNDRIEILYWDDDGLDLS